MILSKRPGRNKAASKVHGRLVAPKTRTSPLWPGTSTPSISFRNVESTRDSAELFLRFIPWFDGEDDGLGASSAPMIASISSKNRIHGAAERARAKALRTTASASPT